MSLDFSDMCMSFTLSPVLSFSKSNALNTDVFANSLKYIISHEQNENQQVAVLHLLLSFYYGALKDFAQSEIKRPDAARETKMTNNFKNLLIEHFHAQHRVGFYSSSLGVSEKYLYMSVKAVTGKSPSYWIDIYLISEAKNMLSTTNLSIAQVSDELNFSSQSHFCKFFKKHTQLTPYAFRASFK